MSSEVQLHAQMGKLQWESAQETEIKTGDTTWRFTGTYIWQFRSRRLNKATHRYHGQRGNCLCGVRGQRLINTCHKGTWFTTTLCILLEGIILVQPTPQGIKSWSEGSAFQQDFAINKGRSGFGEILAINIPYT